MEDKSMPKHSEMLAAFSRPKTFGPKPEAQPIVPSPSILHDENTPGDNSNIATRKLRSKKSKSQKSTDLTKTNITLPEDLLRRAKVFAINNGLTLTEVFNSAISEYLRRKEEKKNLD